MNWIDEVMSATAEAETPRSFIRWAALSSIAAVVADRVYLDKYFYKLYPNIYVLLIADSGLRKGFAAALAKTLVSLVDTTRVISGRNSIEAIIKDLSTTVTRPKRAPLTKAHGFIVSGELSTTFIDNPFTFTILLDLFDSQYHTEGWKNTLKSTGVEGLKDISITMLGAINPTLFSAMIQKKDITSGFIARNIIIHEKTRALKNALVNPPEKAFETAPLAQHLKKISEIEGQFVWDPEAKEYFRSWYMSYSPEKLDDNTGTANRIHDTILKISMLLALSEGTELILKKHHIEGAMDLLAGSVKQAGGMTKGAGLTDFAPKIKLVIDEITKNGDHRMKRSELLRRHWSDIIAPELDVIVSTLEQGGGITIKKIAEGKDEVYIATEGLLENIELFQKPTN